MPHSNTDDIRGGRLFYNDKFLRDRIIGDIIPYAQTRVPISHCTVLEKVWHVTNLLHKHLESYTDCIVVTDSGKFVGVIDGREWIKNFLKEPTREFFSLYSSDIMSPEQILQVGVNTKLSYIIENWKKQRRAIVIIEDNEKSICAPISLRTILEIISLSRTDVMISDINKKKIITISKDDKIIDAFSKMIQNKVRRLLIEGTYKFISDRIVIDNVINRFHFLRDSEKFSEKTIADLQSKEILKVNNNMSISELCGMLIVQKYPCVLYNDNIITPFDMLEKI